MSQLSTKKVKVLRTFGNDKETLGVISVTDSNSVKLTAKTLELGDHNNEQGKSCILPGKYICKWTLSPHMGIFTYEIIGVPNRAGIRIHSANFFKQLLGCIAMGDAHKDINADGELDVIHSGDTLEKFNTLMNKEDFELEIIKAY